MTTKIPVELSSTPGIVDGSNATAITIDSSERVGIGTTSPSVPLDIVTALSSDTQSTPETVLTLATKYTTTTGADGAAGAGARLEFKIPDDETNPITGAAIAGIKENGDDSDASAGMAFYISQNDTTLDEAVRIDHDGKVGIGNSTPGSAYSFADDLVVGNTSGAHGISIVSQDNTNGALHFTDALANDDGAASYVGYLAYNHASNYMFFGTSSTERMRIDSSGRLLLNTTSVYSDSNDIFVANGGRSNFTASGISSGAFNRQTNTGDIIAFLYNGGGKGSISTDGTNVAYNTSSDARLKNILGEAKGLDIVSQLNPVNFEWKESGQTQDGLIAQEVEPLIPEAVSTNEHTGFYEMDYSKLVTPLIKAIQEQQEQIEQLKAEVQTLKENK